MLHHHTATHSQIYKDILVIHSSTPLDLLRGVHCKRRPDRAGTGFPQENNTNCAKW